MKEEEVDIITECGDNLPRLAPRQVVTKPDKIYWDWYQVDQPAAAVAARRRWQGESIMSDGKARNVLGLWRRVGLAERNAKLNEEMSYDKNVEPFRKESKVLESGGRNEKGYTLQDFHEAYQVLLKGKKFKRKSQTNK